MAEVEAGLVSVSSETDGQFEGIDGAWSFKVTPEPAGPPNLYAVTVRVTCADGSIQDITATARIDTPEELVAFRNGGILPYVVRQLVRT